MDETVHMQITVSSRHGEGKRATDGNKLEAFEGLAEDAANDILLHAAWPRKVHDVCGTALVHEARCDVEAVVLDPSATHAQHVRVFGE